ncbi:MAG: DoxX family protein [Gemmatimonadales bacterium]
MWRRIVQTENSIAPLIARLSLALVLFPHGAQHLLGWFGGYGFKGTLGWMTGTAGFPAPLAALAIVVEFFAPIALVLGLLGRPAALGLFGLMLGAASVHTANGFFMNWFGQMPAGTEGFEYHIITLGLAATVVLTGSGAWSIDRLLAARQEGMTAAQAVRA